MEQSISNNRNVCIFKSVNGEITGKMCFLVDENVGSIYRKCLRNFLSGHSQDIDQQCWVKAPGMGHVLIQTLFAVNTFRVSWGVIIIMLCIGTSAI